MTCDCDCDFAPCGHDNEIEKGSLAHKMLTGEAKVCKLLKHWTRESVTLKDMKKNKDGSVECEMVYDGEDFVVV